MTKGDIFELDPFIPFHNAYSKPFCKHPRGGISCFIQKGFMRYILDVNNCIDNFIVVTLKGNHTLFGAYITPSDSIYFDENSFCELSNIFTPKNSDYAVIGGDLNSRVGDLIVTPPCAQTKYRINPDQGRNAHGTVLAKFCKTFHCYVLNNLAMRNLHFDGKNTLHKGDRSSQVNLCLANLTALHAVDTFEIKDIGWNPPDHFPICTTFRLPTSVNNLAILVAEDLNTIAGMPVKKKPVKIDSGLVNWDSYAAILRGFVPNLSNNLPITALKEYMDSLIDTLSNKMYIATKHCQYH